jgi:hypothetical protein
VSAGTATAWPGALPFLLSNRLAGAVDVACGIGGRVLVFDHLQHSLRLPSPTQRARVSRPVQGPGRGGRCLRLLSGGNRSRSETRISKLETLIWIPASAGMTPLRRRRERSLDSQSSKYEMDLWACDSASVIWIQVIGICFGFRVLCFVLS